MKLAITFGLLGLTSLVAASPRALLEPRGFDHTTVAYDKLWEILTCKGGALMHSLNDPGAAQSHWKGDMKQELATWGYKEGFVSLVQCDMKGYWSVETACKALGLDTRPKMYGGSNICYNFEHFQDGSVPKRHQTYEVNGKRYRVTGANLQIAVNPVGGAIFQQYVTSPKTAARNTWNENPADDELPKLRALSDIMWGAWNRENPNIKNIRYFWVQGVANSRTKAAIARVLNQAGQTLEKWPGSTYSMETDAGKALLGSENGACFGFFLATHKAELGGMSIDRVTVFKKDGLGNFDPDLLFYAKGGPAASFPRSNAPFRQYVEKDCQAIVRKV